MANPNDIVRDAILRFLYARHRKAKSPKSAGVGIRDLQKAMKKEYGYKQQEVASNLDYLIQKGWVREVIENRTFTTKAGTTQQAEKRSYKISDTGIDRLEAASTYQRPPLAQQVNITNIKGVTVVGNDNVVNTSFTDLASVLNDMRAAVLACDTLTDEQKLEVVADIDSLQSQIQKPKPARQIIKALWGGIEKAVTAAGFGEIVAKAAAMIAPLIH
ncbi:MAG: hypothetical protein KatS3mg082_2937 [Nitrospiraceae bacterium]|nr:MAG: hypothetical protein KatS3mg081_2462 [Gemmatimonadales bacterium]GIW56533.1 MAG: hypothetical protein KatS3mg082_2937 [Nitrospiraceae bacterium]